MNLHRGGRVGKRAGMLRLDPLARGETVVHQWDGESDLDSAICRPVSTWNRRRYS